MSAAAGGGAGRPRGGGASRHAPGVVLALAAWLGPAGAAGTVDYTDLAPLFAERCVVCHSGEGAPLQLRLDSLAGIRAGSAKGPVVAPGRAEDSELIRRLRGSTQPRMPPTGPPFLSEADIDRIAAWIDAGLPAGAGASESAPPAPAATPAAGEPVTFAHVERIFLQRCVKCHKLDGQLGAPPEGLRLTGYAEILAGAERVVVVPGNPPASLLMRHVKGYERPRMPFDGPPYLSESDITLLQRWIDDGARDREGRRAPMPVGREVRFRGIWQPDGRLDDLRVGRPRSGDSKAPVVGDAAEVRGRVRGDGSIEVTRLRRR